MKLPVYVYNAEVLRKRALPVDEITPEIVKLAHDMIETMVDSNGIGLAATQVGKLIRMFVIREEIQDESGNYVLGPNEVIINPHLSKPSDEKLLMKEGCLSLPNLQIDVIRPQSIHIRYQNLKGQWIEEHLQDFRARMFMHENDHLNGVLTIDRMDKRDRKKLDAVLALMDKKHNS